jgi:putative hydrolase of the HAD superfamily
MQTPMIPWDSIETVMLDMDGTILDLYYDRHFWFEHLPARYAQFHQLDITRAMRETREAILAQEGNLNWYCLDYWGERFGMDMSLLKREIKHLIGYLDGSEEFIRQVKAMGKPLWLVTNAHWGSIEVKMEQTNLHQYFDQIICSHDFGLPKEDPAFWQALQAKHPYQAAHTLFIDDNPNVLQGAKNAGLTHLINIRKPDSQRGEKHTLRFPSVRGLKDLIPSRF